MTTVIDANVLVALFRADTEDAEKVRINGLLAETRGRRKRLIIPSPALSEFAAKAKQEEIDFLLSQPVFQIAAFDAKAALECGELLRAWANGLDGSKKDRHKAKFDMQILAIAKAHGARLLVTGDANLRNKATKQGIEAKEIKELPIPESARQYKISFETLPSTE